MRSVTSLKNDFFEQFDGPAIVERYFGKWSNDECSKYYPLIEFLCVGHVINPDACKAVILEIWKFKGDRSIKRGRKLHRLIENFLNGEGAKNEHLITESCGVFKKSDTNIGQCGLVEAEDEVDAAKYICYLTDILMQPVERPTHIHLRDEYAHFMSWLEKNAAKYKIFKTEWRVISKRLNLIGVIDAAFTVVGGDENELFLVDWKRCQNIEFDHPFGKMGRAPPFNVLPDCNFGHYSMQLNVYARIIEDAYAPLKVSKMSIVQFWADRFKEYEVKRLFR